MEISKWTNTFGNKQNITISLFISQRFVYTVNHECKKYRVNKVNDE